MLEDKFTLQFFRKCRFGAVFSEVPEEMVPISLNLEGEARKSIYQVDPSCRLL